jgi:hypothetical protein
MRPRPTRARRTNRLPWRTLPAALLAAALLLAALLLAAPRLQAQPVLPANPAAPADAPASSAAAASPTSPAAPPAASRAAGSAAALPELAFIERLYREGDGYRAESEALRFLHAHPRHPQAPAVELARAKLYYRDGRYGEANLMLYSLLDRHPRDETAQPARRLLTYSHLRLGEPAEAAETVDALAPPGGAAPSLAELAAPPDGAVDADAAARWSSWLPGSGYLLLGQPGKAAVGMTLNAALIGAAVVSANAANAPAAALFLVLEGLLWQGGRSGVRQDAEALNARLRARRTDDWLARHGEPELLGVGIALRFGGG